MAFNTKNYNEKFNSLVNYFKANEEAFNIALNFAIRNGSVQESERDSISYEYIVDVLLACKHKPSFCKGIDETIDALVSADW